MSSVTFSSSVIGFDDGNPARLGEGEGEGEGEGKKEGRGEGEGEEERQVWVRSFLGPGISEVRKRESRTTYVKT